jgi:hypothetical protein
MAVVVDRAFWDSLGEMRDVRDLSNLEIAWFGVAFSRPEEGRLRPKCNRAWREDAFRLDSWRN